MAHLPGPPFSHERENKRTHTHTHSTMKYHIYIERERNVYCICKSREFRFGSHRIAAGFRVWRPGSAVAGVHTTRTAQFRGLWQQAEEAMAAPLPEGSAWQEGEARRGWLICQDPPSPTNERTHTHTHSTMKYHIYIWRERETKMCIVYVNPVNSDSGVTELRQVSEYGGQVVQWLAYILHAAGRACGSSAQFRGLWQQAEEAMAEPLPEGSAWKEGEARRGWLMCQDPPSPTNERTHTHTHSTMKYHIYIYT
jgi:hypothetical protein